MNRRTGKMSYVTKLNSCQQIKPIAKMQHCFLQHLYLQIWVKSFTKPWRLKNSQSLLTKRQKLKVWKRILYLFPVIINWFCLSWSLLTLAKQNVLPSESKIAIQHLESLISKAASPLFPLPLHLWWASANLKNI